MRGQSLPLIQLLVINTRIDKHIMNFPSQQTEAFCRVTFSEPFLQDQPHPYSIWWFQRMVRRVGGLPLHRMFTKWDPLDEVKLVAGKLHHNSSQDAVWITLRSTSHHQHHVLLPRGWSLGRKKRQRQTAHLEKLSCTEWNSFLTNAKNILAKLTGTEPTE
jgi:hypothetical protein